MMCLNRKSDLELPPRARRIPAVSGSIESGFGTTSACAENTMATIVPTSSLWNYLRMRGEYNRGRRYFPSRLELPPHARRIPLLIGNNVDIPRTTSACAENTVIMLRHVMQLWNYLRMRGEYWLRLVRSLLVLELPPHARRIRMWWGHQLLQLGTTSACAENTRTSTKQVTNNRNYLRMRGEYNPSQPYCYCHLFSELNPSQQWIHL